LIVNCLGKKGKKRKRLRKVKKKDDYGGFIKRYNIIYFKIYYKKIRYGYLDNRCVNIKKNKI